MTHVLASEAGAKADSTDVSDLALMAEFEPSEQALEVLGQSPMDIWQAFLEEERAAALAAKEKAAQEAEAEPEPLPPSSAALLEEETAPPAPIVEPLPAPPDMPAPDPVPAPEPVEATAPSRGWGAMVKIQQALSLPTPPADDTDYGGWVTYLKGDESPEDGPMAPYETAALPRTEAIVTGLERAVGIVPPPAPLFDTLVALPDPAQEPVSGLRLGLRELVERVLSDDLEVRIQKARALERGFAVGIARAANRPTVNIEAAAGPSLDLLDENAGPMPGAKAELGLDVNYTLFDFGSARYGILEAQNSLASAEAQVENQSNEKLFEVFDTLLRIGQISETLTANERHLDRLTELRELIAANIREGNTTEVDIKRVDSRVEAARSGLISLRSQKANAASSFRRLTGLEADTVDFAGLYRAPAAVAGLTVEDMADNPEIRANDAEIAALAAQEEAARRARMPTLTLGGGLDFLSEDMLGEEDDALNAEVLLRLNIPLFDGGISANRRGQIRAQRTEAELRRLRTLRKMEEEAANIATFTDSQSEKTTLLEDRVRSLENVAALYRDQFGIGTRSVFELLESEADLLAARTELSAHLHERTRSALQLMRLRGMLPDMV